MAAPVLDVLDRLGILADDTRARLLLLLDEHELTVSEIQKILRIPQSTASRQLKLLADAGWVSSRAEGTTRWYAIARERLSEADREIWALVRQEIEQTAAASQVAERARAVVAERRATSREFFSSAAGEWDRLRTELFGSRPEMLAIPALLDASWVVGDLGAGTGQLAATLAPWVARVIAVDGSAEMLAAARARLSDVSNVELLHGELERLPMEDASLDAAILALVLPYVAEPLRALEEARRVLRPGGRLLVVDMRAHDRDDLRRMGHLWQGFDEARMTGWLREAKFTNVRYVPLSPDVAASGPTLFACSARAGAALAAALVAPDASMSSVASAHGGARREMRSVAESAVASASAGESGAEIASARDSSATAVDDSPARTAAAELEW
ncbi:MAG TPA: metalloregulator ArsR/SmtB family transcription factor [Gemmatimonadaceae bacterium]|nr:metalloregulator ArsR/SmtB family transcription factor [Gemmatimonadaceae bacterium]